MYERLLKPQSSLLVFLAIWLLSAGYVAMNLDKGWSPHDEGTLGQAAERILHGQVPNRDFTDPYTGGLAYIDAFIFKLFGINLLWLRLFLFLVFLIWVPAVFAIAREFLDPVSAGVVTLVAVAWSVPNYTGAMPSWFCLFLATFGTFALASYIRKPAVSWLIVAGFCGGSAFLIKSVALYFIAAALLFFVFREQSLARLGVPAPRRTTAYVVFLGVCLSIFVLSLVRLVFRIGGLPEYLHFVLPGFALSCFLLARERVQSNVPTRKRFSSLLLMATPFLLATAAPIFLFALFYWHERAIRGLFESLFVAPFHRVLFARIPPYDLIMEIPSVLAVVFFSVVAEFKTIGRRIALATLAAVGIFFLLSARHNDLTYIIAVASMAGIIPLLILLAGPALARAASNGSTALQDNQLLALLASVTALFSLIQFPFAHLIYFAYVAPLAVLLAANLLFRILPSNRLLLGSLAAFLILFGIFVFRTHLLTLPTKRDYASAELGLPRSGPLKVSQSDAAKYRELISFVKSLAGDQPIIAGPDCPQVYFLAGIPNPTPVLFDFLHDPSEYEKQMRSLVDRPDPIRVLVLNEDPQFSTEELPILQSLAAQSFNRSKEIGNFKVYWRQ